MTKELHVIQWYEAVSCMEACSRVCLRDEDLNRGGLYVLGEREKFRFQSK